MDLKDMIGWNLEGDARDVDAFLSIPIPSELPDAEAYASQSEWAQDAALTISTILMKVSDASYNTKIVALDESEQTDVGDKLAERARRALHSIRSAVELALSLSR